MAGSKPIETKKRLLTIPEKHPFKITPTQSVEQLRSRACIRMLDRTFSNIVTVLRHHHQNEYLRVI